MYILIYDYITPDETCYGITEDYETESQVLAASDIHKNNPNHTNITYYVVEEY